MQNWDCKPRFLTRNCFSQDRFSVLSPCYLTMKICSLSSESLPISVNKHFGVCLAFKKVLIEWMLKRNKYLKTNSQRTVIRKLKCNEPFTLRKGIQKSSSPTSLQLHKSCNYITCMQFPLRYFYIPPKNYHLLTKPIAPSRQPWSACNSNLCLSKITNYYMSWAFKTHSWILEAMNVISKKAQGLLIL